MRITTTPTSLNRQEFYRFHWTSAGTPQWLPDVSYHEHTFDDGRHDTVRVSTYDDIAWRHPYMQDMIRTKTYGFSPYHDVNGEEFQTDYVGLNVSTFPGEIVTVPVSWILSQSGISQTPVGQDTMSLYYSDLAVPKTKAIDITEQPFDSDFSIWYLLVDLKELPRLASSFIGKHNVISSLRSAAPKGATLTALINSRLALTYGVRPTLEDIKEFIRLFVHWGSFNDEQLKKFGVVHTFKQPKRALDEQTILTSSQFVNVFGGGVSLHTRHYVTPRVLHLTAKYYFVMPELAGVLNRMKQLVDLLGVFDPAALWDVLPFSFVVDWFYDVTTWLHRNLKPRLFPVDIYIPDWCESIMRDISVQCNATYTGSRSLYESESLLSNVDIYHGNAYQYARKRQFPNKLKLVRSPFKLDMIVRLQRVINGSCVAYQKGRAMFPREGHVSNYRKRAH